MLPKYPFKNLENPTVIPRRASTVYHVFSHVQVTGYKSCRAFVKHVLLFVMCILCELIIPISPCIHTIKLEKLDKDKVTHPVVGYSLRAMMSKSLEPQPESKCTQGKRKAYNFRCMFKLKKKCWKYCTLKLKEKIKCNYYCKWFFLWLFKKKRLDAFFLEFFPSISSFQQLSNTEYY